MFTEFGNIAPDASRPAHEGPPVDSDANAFAPERFDRNPQDIRNITRLFRI
jgi:hypothetical protein